jgi:hypothetical protein
MPNIDMTITIWTVICVVGLILLAVSAIGGGVVVWQINFPILRSGSRLLTGIIGLGLMALGLWGSMLKSNTPEDPDKKTSAYLKPQSEVSSTKSEETDAVVASKNLEEPSRTEPRNAAAFIVQAGSFDMAITSKEQIRNTLEMIKKCSGMNLKITSNSEYKFLTPQKWVISAGPFAAFEAAEARDKIISCGVKDAIVREIR